MMYYKYILISVVSFWILAGVLWPLSRLTLYHIRKQKIRPPNFNITKDEVKRQERILYRVIVKRKLAGFRAVTWMTLWATIIPAMLTSFNYLHSIQLDIQDRRPWVTITSPQIILTEVGKKNSSGNPLLINMYIENIGKAPAKFISEMTLKNSYPGVHLSEEEPSVGIIFPGEKRRIGWLARWNNEDEAILTWARDVRGPEILCVLCGAEIKITYRPLGSLIDEHFTLSGLDWSQSNQGYIGTVEQSFRTLDAK